MYIFIIKDHFLFAKPLFQESCRYQNKDENQRQDNTPAEPAQDFSEKCPDSVQIMRRLRR
jgi:hypothetical protein